MKARISSTEDGIWLVIERSDKKYCKDFMFANDPKFEQPEGMAFPLIGDEIEAIRDACNKWLKENKR